MGVRARLNAGLGGNRGGVFEGSADLVFDALGLGLDCLSSHAFDRLERVRD